LLRGDRVEVLATSALVEGLDDPMLRQLAGRTTSSEDLPPIAAALRELGVRFPSRVEAARTIAMAVSSGIVQGEIDPIAGAADLSVISREVGPTFHELDPFIYAESEAESRPEDRDFFRKAIVDEAARWVSTGRGSTGCETPKLRETP
jgi:hypothetical protein